MNKSVILLFSFILLSCSHRQEPTLYYQTDDEFAKRDWFDIEEYWSNRDSIEDYVKEFTNSDTIRIEKGWNALSHNYYQKCYRTKDNIKMQITSNYYLSGEIMDKYLFWNDYYSFLIGKEYLYDKMGNIINIIDHDEPFKFTLEQVMNFIKENNIKGYYLIRRIDPNPIWKIIVFHPVTEKWECCIVLNGVSGEILEEKLYN